MNRYKKIKASKKKNLIGNFFCFVYFLKVEFQYHPQIIWFLPFFSFEFISPPYTYLVLQFETEFSYAFVYADRIIKEQGLTLDIMIINNHYRKLFLSAFESA